MEMKNIVLTLLLLMQGILATAQNGIVGAGGYNMSYIGMSEGLPSNSIQDIFEDSFGFMWIASDVGGLVRYDGYSFLHLSSGAYGQLLRSNSCRNLCEDRFGRLWVAFDEGVDVLDLKTLRTVMPQDLALAEASVAPLPQGKEQDAASVLKQLMSQPAKRVYADSKGCIWLITDRQVVRLAFDEQGRMSSLLTHGYSARAFDIAICDVESDGRPWVAIDGGIFRLSATPAPQGQKQSKEKPGKAGAAGGQTLVRQEVARALTSEIVGNYVTCMARQGGTVWLGTNIGLVAFDMASRQTTRYTRADNPLSQGGNGENFGLSHQFVTCLLPVGQQLLVGTLNGIDILSGPGRFERWNASDKVNPLSSNFVHCIFMSHGLLWVGTDNAGISKLFPRYLTLHNYLHTSQPESISAGPVNAMLTESDGTLWVGTVEGGLNRKAPDSDVFEHYTTANTGLRHNSVSVIVRGKDDDLWLGTWGGGVHRADRNHPSNIVPLEVPDEYRYIINYVGALAYDSLNDGLWIASNGGIYFYNLATRQMEEPYEGCRDVRGCIGSIIDRDNHLWIGCLDGVRVIDLNRGNSKVQSSKFKVRALRTKLDAPESGITEKITCFWQSADGALWMGSNGYGLYKRTVDKSGKETFTNYTTVQGLANNAVKGIVEDKNGLLWITTTNGLSMMNTQTGTFLNFSDNDGLPSSQFYWNSAVIGSDGLVYLGADNGLSVLEGLNTSIVYAGKLSFTRLLVGNQEATAPSTYLDQDISKARIVRLHESDKSFTIEFSALNYSGERQGLYSYRLKGFDKRWAQLEPGKHEVRYTNLPSGHYTLEVKYVSGMQTDDNVISLDIRVTPYFWKSWWFLLLLSVAMAALAIYAYNRRVSYLRKREAERLLEPIEQALRESDNPQQVQARIESILSNQRRYSQSSAKSVEADAMEQEKNTVPFMDRVMAIVERNYMNSEFGVPEFCEQMGMSRSLLAKRLNEEVGQSTTQFIRNYRLDIARQILRKADQRNIAEIAFSVGFNDPKYFTRCFTKLYGVSPKSFDERTTAAQTKEAADDNET